MIWNKSTKQTCDKQRDPLAYMMNIIKVDKDVQLLLVALSR